MVQLAGPGPSAGPNGSVPFGQARAVDDLQQRLREGPLRQQPHIPPPQNLPQQPGGAAPAAPGAGPVQPAPPQAQGPQGPPQLINQQPTPEPWRKRLQTWAMHPDAGPELQALGALSALDQIPAEALRRLSSRAPT